MTKLAGLIALSALPDEAEYIEALYTLQQVVKESTVVVEATVEKVVNKENPETKEKIQNFILKMGRELKGKCVYKQIKVNVAVGQQPWPDPAIRHIVVGMPVLVFYNEEPKSIMYFNRMFIQVYGDNDPNAWWTFTHIEIHMNRTFNGPQNELVKLTRDAIAGKIPWPQPNPKRKALTQAFVDKMPLWGQKGWDTPEPEPVPASKTKPRVPVSVKADKGLKYEYYHGEWQNLPDFDQLKPVEEGIVATFDIGKRKQEENFAFRFRGYVQVPKDGVYTFYTVSDDGSRLLIGTEEVVDNDGLHAATESVGQINLKKGLHPITVTFFQGGGDKALDVLWEGPDLPKGKIPETALFFSKTGKP